ncbi:hypothetical protein HYT58_00535 [Candidatus Woesearchaeota archaeon]|nr:hypothetical protein [Candidatus Woesearchaeota archaeon]
MRNQQHSSYFEAILQLRPETDELIKFISNQLKKRDNVRISKIIKLKKGVDLYLTDQRFARALGKKLKRSFNGTLTLSRTLHSINRETNKEQYRVTVCFRMKEQ